MRQVEVVDQERVEPVPHMFPTGQTCYFTSKHSLSLTCVSEVLAEGNWKYSYTMNRGLSEPSTNKMKCFVAYKITNGIH